MIHEEILKASVAYNERTGKLRVIGGDAILSQEEYITFNKNPDFIAGAKLADKTMIEKACEAFCKIECNGYPPRSTCTSLGTCERYDNFYKAMKGE